jgi:hypothetical protein
MEMAEKVFCGWLCSLMMLLLLLNVEVGGPTTGAVIVDVVIKRLIL